MRTCSNEALVNCKQQFKVIYDLCHTTGKGQDTQQNVVLAIYCRTGFTPMNCSKRCSFPLRSLVGSVATNLYTLLPLYVFQTDS